MENPLTFEGFHGKSRSFWMVSEGKIIYKQNIFHGYGQSPDGNGISTYPKMALHRFQWSSIHGIVIMEYQIGSRRWY